MHSGSLDRRITVQSLSTTENAYGEPLEAWADDRKLWAAYSPGTGQERREAAQERATVTATFIVRDSAHTRALSASANRIAFGGQVWDIVSALPSARRGDHITITATARADT
ncbi:MAG: phage head closure protein [Litorimonas sp.]